MSIPILTRVFLFLFWCRSNNCIWVNCLRVWYNFKSYSQSVFKLSTKSRQLWGNISLNLCFTNSFVWFGCVLCLYLLSSCLKIIFDDACACPHPFRWFFQKRLWFCVRSWVGWGRSGTPGFAGGNPHKHFQNTKRLAIGWQLDVI